MQFYMGKVNKIFCGQKNWPTKFLNINKNVKVKGKRARWLCRKFAGKSAKDAARYVGQDSWDTCFFRLRSRGSIDFLAAPPLCFFGPILVGKWKESHSINSIWSSGWSWDVVGMRFIILCMRKIGPSPPVFFIVDRGSEMETIDSEKCLSGLHFWFFN